MKTEVQILRFSCNTEYLPHYVYPFCIVIDSVDQCAVAVGNDICNMNTACTNTVSNYLCQCNIDGKFIFNGK